MLTILITDDQQEEREGIASLILKYEYNLKLLFATNGLNALECLEKNHVDILITDVRMPFMDGLKLTENALKINPLLKVIIFSGFSEFEYAKTALSLGVTEYILKPINIEEFKNVMEKVISLITESRQKKLDTEIKLDYAKKHILFNMINNTLWKSSSPIDISNYFPYSYEGMILLEFDHNFFDNVGAEFEQSIMSYVSLPVDYLNLNMCQSLLFLQKQKSLDSIYLHNVANSIHDWIMASFNECCYLAIAQNLNHLEELPSTFAKLEQLMDYRFFVPDTYIFDETEKCADYYPTEHTDEQLFTDIQSDLRMKDFLSLKIHLDYLSRKYEKKTNFSHIYIKFMFSSIYKDIMTQLYSISELELNNTVDRLFKSTDIHELIRLLINTVEQLEEKYTLNEPAANREIQMVKQYIEDHYGDDLDLGTLADKVYLSPRYLSTIFKKTTGWGINKYIKTIRMEKAKELLKIKNNRIIDICNQTGYHNLSYFCQNFREFYGLTPEEYRKKGINENAS